MNCKLNVLLIVNFYQNRDQENVDVDFKVSAYNHSTQRSGKYLSGKKQISATFYQKTNIFTVSSWKVASR